MNFFRIAEHNTTIGREVTAGLVTFMTMAYIVLVNPLILAGAGMPKAAVVTATCLGACVPTLLMGLWANYPLALASGMGLNAALVFQASQPGMTWQTMMGVVIVEGALVTILVLTGVRESVMRAIPLPLKQAIAIGIGLFIAFLGLQQMGWVAQGQGGAFLSPGHLANPTAIIATLGLLLMMALLHFRVPGAILWGIIGATALAWCGGLLFPTRIALVKHPDQLLSWPDFSTLGQADVRGALAPSLLGVVFAFLITDFFDTMGTVIAVGFQAGLLDKEGHLPRLNRVLAVDSLAAIWGGFCGASSVTTYIESAAGVSAGARTGLSSVVVGALFLCTMFLAPIITMVPAAAAGPALVIVGFMMIGLMREMDFSSPADAVPAVLTVLLIPLSQSIAYGIGLGILLTALARILTGRVRGESPWLFLFAALFAWHFAFAHP